MSKRTQYGFATRAIHAGQEPDVETGAVSVPIHATSTYVQQELGKNKGYEYARVSNPTCTRLENNLAALEGGVASRVFASGMAAITAMCTMLRAGDHIICSHNVYGGVPRLFNQILAHYGLEFSYVDTTDAGAVEKAIRRNTKFAYVETPTNPLMAVSDIAAIARVCHRRDVELVVDNTFMSPYFQRPLELGADMVVHSTTKFLNGHSDGLGGVISLETGSLRNAKRMLAKVRVCSLGESLGGVETLISHPATMTHAALGEKGRKTIGITDGMVRISVGIEDVEDIIEDLDQALAAI